VSKPVQTCLSVSLSSLCLCSVCVLRMCGTLLRKGQTPLRSFLFSHEFFSLPLSLTNAPQTTHVLCPPYAATVEAVLARVSQPPPNAKADLQGVLPPRSAVFVKAAWLQECLRMGQRVPTAPFELPRTPLAPPSPKRSKVDRGSAASLPAVPERRRSVGGGSDSDRDRDRSPGAGQRSKTPDPPRVTAAPLLSPPASAAEARLADANALAEVAVRRAMAAGKLRMGPGHTLYFCYNCGSPSHGAIGCPRPPRGSPANPYVPPMAGARERVDKAWVCARAHPLDQAIHPNAHIIKPFEALLEGYETAARDKVGGLGAWGRGGAMLCP